MFSLPHNRFNVYPHSPASKHKNTQGQKPLKILSSQHNIFPSPFGHFCYDIIIEKTSKLYPGISGVRGESLTRTIDLKFFLEKRGWSTHMRGGGHTET